MEIHVRINRLQHSIALCDHAVRRIRSHLWRFRRELATVVVRIGEINGPKGTVCKRCQITVQGRFGSSTLNELAGDASMAIDQAVERTERELIDQLAAQRFRFVQPPRWRQSPGS